MGKEVGKWLTRRFLDWQSSEGQKKTVKEFADFLGVSRGTLNKWINGERNPRGRSIGQLAAKLGPEIYDVLGLRRPKGQGAFDSRPEIAY